MRTEITYLFATAGLYWAQILVAASLSGRLWTMNGVQISAGNRDTMPEPSVLAARATRAVTNMRENLVLYLAVLLGALTESGDPAQIALGAAIFFWARLAHGILYVVGVPYLRTLAWLVCLVGVAVVGSSVL